MRRARKFLVGGALMVVVAGTSLGVAASSARAQSSDEGGRTIALYSAGGTETDISVTGKPTESPGDESIEEQPVYSAADRTQLLGHGYVLFTILTATTANLHSVITLPGGSIILDGVKAIALESAQVAVTGGTGIYSNARGQAFVAAATGPSAATITIDLAS